MEGRIVKMEMMLQTQNLCKYFRKQKADTLEAARMLQKKGYKLYATGGSSQIGRASCRERV